MNLQLSKKDVIWNNWYELAREYYHRYGSLDMNTSYTTKDGSKLGMWVYNQRMAYKGISGYKLKKERIDKLNQIGMIWDGHISLEDRWLNNFRLIEKYQEYYGHLNIPLDFKTFDGINYDEKGFKIGVWLHNQYLAYIGKKAYDISKERIEKLENIGINWNDTAFFDEKWNKKYILAKKYFEENGNLLISSNYVVLLDGKKVKLGNWIVNQRVLYKKGKLSKDKIDKLNEIGMVWNARNVIYSNLMITEKNSKKIKLALLKELKNMLDNMNGYIKTKDDIDYINESFMEKLNSFQKRKNK